MSTQEKFEAPGMPGVTDNHEPSVVERRAELSKELRPVDFFSLGFGKIIGVGWLTVLGSAWLAQAGPMGSFIAFAAGAVVMIGVGFCFAEMATALPVAGGEVAYAYEIFGTRTCFVTAWFLILSNLGTTAFEAISIGWIAGSIVPGIEGPILYSFMGEPIRLGSLALGLAGMAVVTVLNYLGTRPAARFQNICAYGLIVLAVIFMGAAFVMGDAANLKPYFKRDESGSIWGGMMAVFVTAPFWYSGFQTIPQTMEEKATSTSLRAAGQVILISIVVGLLFYCSVILAASMTMPWNNLIDMELPTATAFEVAFGSTLLAKVVLLAALMGLVTTWNTTFISACRMLFALGRARIIHPAFGWLHVVYRSPSAAVMFVCIFGCVGALLGRSAIEIIVNTGGIVLSLTFFLISMGVIKLRITHPNLARPYRVPGGMVTAGLTAAASLGMAGIALVRGYRGSEGGLPPEWILLLAWAALGAVAYMAARGVRRSVSEDERAKLMFGIYSGTR